MQKEQKINIEFYKRKNHEIRECKTMDRKQFMQPRSAIGWMYSYNLLVISNSFAFYEGEKNEQNNISINKSICGIRSDFWRLLQCASLPRNDDCTAVFESILCVHNWE